jgi:hypothetical protein
MQQRYSEAIHLTGGGLLAFLSYKEKSAEIIVAASHEPLERTEVSRGGEGSNVKLFQML